MLVSFALHLLPLLLALLLLLPLMNHLVQGGLLLLLPALLLLLLLLLGLECFKVLLLENKSMIHNMQDER